MSKLPNTIEMIREMAKLTILSGRINALQEKNMTTYPFIFFNKVESVGVDYDLADSSTSDQSSIKLSPHGRVTYHIESTENNPDHIEKRCKALASSVSNLFWPTVITEIYLNNNKIFEGNGADKEIVMKETKNV